MGMPVIATYTGGVPSLIEERRTGLFFPTGDAPTLAARLRQVFDNDDLAARLGTQSHRDAAIRHDPDTVVKQLAVTYDRVLTSHSDAPTFQEAPAMRSITRDNLPCFVDNAIRVLRTRYSTTAARVVAASVGMETRDTVAYLLGGPTLATSRKPNYNQRLLQV